LRKTKALVLTDQGFFLWLRACAIRGLFMAMEFAEADAVRVETALRPEWIRAALVMAGSGRSASSSFGGIGAGGLKRHVVQR
jgi:hypothetical protein